MSALDNIILDNKATGAINYVKARYAIDSPTSGLRSRRDRRSAKLEVIKFLQGTITHPEPTKQRPSPKTLVVFPDQTHAVF